MLNFAGVRRLGEGVVTWRRAICCLGQAHGVQVFCKKAANAGNLLLLLRVVMGQEGDTVRVGGDGVYGCSKRLQMLLANVSSCVRQRLQLKRMCLLDSQTERLKLQQHTAVSLYQRFRLEES